MRVLPVSVRCSCNAEEVRQHISDIEELNQQLLMYLVKVASLDISDESEKQISKLHTMINDFYREAEIADNMMKYTKYVLEHDLKFSDHVYSQIKTLNLKLKEQYENVYQLFTTNNKDLINEIDALEEEIDNLRSDMTNQHIERLEKNECSPASSGVFINLVSNLERAGDHLGYIAHAIVE